MVVAVTSVVWAAPQIFDARSLGLVSMVSMVAKHQGSDTKAAKHQGSGQTMFNKVEEIPGTCIGRVKTENKCFRKGGSSQIEFNKTGHI